MWEVMFWPIVACVLLPWLLVYLGLHVVRRGIIFIDIAMAQMASLGICVAILFRLEPESWTTFAIGLAFTWFGVLQGASVQFERYANLKTVQISREDLATAGSGFMKDVDVQTTEGALTVIPVGLLYLMFAPFPWDFATLRQTITLHEIILWWMSFPLLVLGLWYSIKHRLRQVSPIIIFTTMLTLAYSLFQGNVGTAYRQRSQLLVFYFIFIAVGAIILKERAEDRRRQQQLAKQELAELQAARVVARRKAATG